jgi:hypothetical protein
LGKPPGSQVLNPRNDVEEKPMAKKKVMKKTKRKVPKKTKRKAKR